MHPLPKAVDDFRGILSDMRPGSVVTVEHPLHAGRMWWLTVDGMPVAYDHDLGFGLFRPEDDHPHRWMPAHEAATDLCARLRPVA